MKHRKVFYDVWDLGVGPRGWGGARGGGEGSKSDSGVLFVREHSQSQMKAKPFDGFLKWNGQPFEH